MAIFCASCASMLQGNLPREPKRQVPPGFGPSSEGANLAQKKWNELFASPELRALIETALANNQELNLRLQEIIIARAEVTARRGEIWPKANFSVGAGIEKVGHYTSQGKTDEANGVPEHLPDFAFGLSASWEIDVWGKLRNAAKAANLRWFASIEARRFLVTQIVAEIARSYYELLSIDAQLEVLRRNIEVQAQALEVVRLQKQAARVTELAVQRFEAEVLKNQSRLYDLEQKKIQAENRINFLLARYPQPVGRNAADLQAPLPQAISAGLPAALLENRADVRQAELELQAAKLDVKAAKAAFYPSLSLDAGIGYRSFEAAAIVATPASLLYNLFANLTAPLFNWAGLTAQFRATNARQLQAVIQYERTLLTAFIEVVNELANLDNLRKSYELQSQQVATLGRSVDVSGVLFRSARADYLEVLLTRRDSLEAEMELIERKRRQYEAMISLYQALGGGWRDAETKR
jgi:NodT family efflux transporter outer membrane factor (OMF) lipoprotein